MKILDKIIEYFFERKIKVKNTICIDEINENYWNAVIYSKLPCMQKYSVPLRAKDFLDFRSP